MLHIIIIRDPVVFQLIQEQIGAKKIPIKHLSYEIYSHGNIRIV